MAEARITLIVRPGCHLCDYAREALQRVRDLTGAGWRECSVDTDVELEREYGERVPVVLLDGREHDYFRVDEQRLVRDLTAGSADPAGAVDPPGAAQQAGGATAG